MIASSKTGSGVYIWTSRLEHRTDRAKICLQLKGTRINSSDDSSGLLQYHWSLENRKSKHSLTSREGSLDRLKSNHNIRRSPLGRRIPLEGQNINQCSFFLLNANVVSADVPMLVNFLFFEGTSSYWII